MVITVPLRYIFHGQFELYSSIIVCVGISYLLNYVLQSILSRIPLIRINENSMMVGMKFGYS